MKEEDVRKGRCREGVGKDNRSKIIRGVEESIVRGVLRISVYVVISNIRKIE